MKFYCVFIVLSVVVFAQALHRDVKHKIRNDQKYCIAETGASKDVVDKLENGKYHGDGSDVKCYSKCMFEKLNFMKNPTEYNVQAIKDFVKNEPNVDKLHDFIHECTALKGKDICEKTYLTYRCYHEKLIKLWGHNHNDE